MVEDNSLFALVTQGRDPKQTHNTTESGSFEGWIRDGERKVFNKRASGHYIVFHPEVLGVAEINEIPPSGYEEFKIAFHPAISRVYGPRLTLPDEGVMRELEGSLSKEVYGRLREHYNGLKLRSDSSNFLRIDVSYGSVFNSLGERISFYHNGARIGNRERSELGSGDIFRIGRSILFSYFHKK